jgi:molybdate transport repressor ModE-like protein
MLDTRRLLILAAVHRQGSLSAAADELGYTVSAVSQQIRKLELEVGQPLVRRSAHGSQLTEAGQALVARAGRIEGELRHAQEDLDEIAGMRRGSLHFGTFPTAAASFLPSSVRTFREQHPGVALKVRSGRLAQLVAMLEQRTVELALLWQYQWSALPTEELEILASCEEPTRLLAAPDHWILTRGVSNMAALTHEAWVTRAQHPVSEVLIRTCQAAGFSPDIVYEASDYQESQAMVAVGMGIALVPHCALGAVRPDVIPLDLGEMLPKRRIVLAHMRGDRLTPSAATMTAILKARLEDSLGNPWVDEAVRTLVPSPPQNVGRPAKHLDGNRPRTIYTVPEQ